MKRTLTASLAVLMLASAAPAAEPESCRPVRLAKPGWNDLAFTSGTAVSILQAMGYDATSALLGTEVIYQSLATGDLDVFLGYWDPAMITYAEPYEKAGSVERLRVNLQGTKYTFAVPAYVQEAGVRDIADLARFADRFDHKMYGIEPGSNQLMLDIIADPVFGLAGWEVIESSEAGMLSEVQRKIGRQEFVVFQGWAPHPMNNVIDMRYLTGGDAYYGADYGAATVSTQTRKGYSAQCPNVGRFLQNLVFDIGFENEGMGLLINDGLAPAEAGRRMFARHPEVLDAWLDGVTTFAGDPALPVVRAALTK